METFTSLTKVMFENNFRTIVQYSYPVHMNCCHILACLFYFEQVHISNHYCEQQSVRDKKKKKKLS